MKRVIVLTDGKAGHENQSKAFARSLGCEAVLVRVTFKSRLVKSLSYALDRLGVRSLALVTLETPVKKLAKGDFAAVLGTGSGTFYAVKALAKRLGVPCGVVLYPRGYDLGSFDCILAPTFDRPPARQNLITLPANLVADDDAFYEKGVAEFTARYMPTGARAVAVVIGGPNKCASLGPAWMTHQLEKIFYENRGSEFWVTTSRRTPLEVERAVKAFPWDYKLLYSEDHFNPIPAFVRLASRIYVTAESTGMLSEACTYGSAEVTALDNLQEGPHKFRRFLENLEAAGYVGGARKIDLTAEFAAARKLLSL